MQPLRLLLGSAVLVLMLAACKSTSRDTVTLGQCNTADDLPFPSAEWTAREAANYARTTEAPLRQSSDADFLLRWQQQSLANRQEYEARRSDPYWNSGQNACASWSSNCTGDPYRYPGVDPFYEELGEVQPVNFYDAQGARLSGRVWSPRLLPADAQLPAVVIINGSVQAPETLYWWAAQMLVENGYLVMTFDPRGQGRSDSTTPDGTQGSNFNSAVFRTNLIDAIDFFYSTPEQPYPHNLAGSPGYEADGGQAATTPFNPLHARFDRSRLGVAGHSLGATGLSVVQGEQPWPGRAVRDNPIKAVVAWDNLALSSSLDGIEVVPRVPAMGQAGDYFLTPAPYTQPPDPEAKNSGFRTWAAHGVPAYQVQIQGGTHYEWSLLPEFPTTDWEPGGDGGWGLPLARHYTLAWFDRWLKKPDEPGYANADARLLASSDWRARMSFYYPSAYAFPSRDGQMQQSQDIRRGC